MAGCHEAAALLPLEPLTDSPDVAEAWKRRRRNALLAVPIFLVLIAFVCWRHAFSLPKPEPVVLPDLQQMVSLAAALDPDQSVLKALGLNLSEAFHHSVNRNLQAAGLEPIREVLEKTEYDPSATIGVAVCVVDVGQTIFQLGQGLLAINAARLSCISGANVSAADKQACSVAVSYAIAGIVWAVSFATDAISQCAGSLNLQAACATDLSVNLGAWSFLSSSISSMVLNCPSSGASLQSLSAVGGRRLGDDAIDVKKLAPDPAVEREAETLEIIEEVKQRNKDEEIRNALKATCFFDIGHAAFWAARVGTSITQATLDCTPDNIASAGEDAKISCTVDVSGVIGAAAFLGSTISLTVAGCPAALDKDVTNTLCAASIIDTVGLIGYFAQSFSSMASTCHELAQQV